MCVKGILPSLQITKYTKATTMQNYPDTFHTHIHTYIPWPGSHTLRDIIPYSQGHDLSFKNSKFLHHQEHSQFREKASQQCSVNYFQMVVSTAYLYAQIYTPIYTHTLICTAMSDKRPGSPRHDLCPTSSLFSMWELPGHSNPTLRFNPGFLLSWETHVRHLLLLEIASGRESPNCFWLFGNTVKRASV